MNLIVCIANNNGIMFNKRRVSKDALLIERLREITKNNKVYISEYSKELFNDFENIIQDISLLENEDYYFLEDENLPYLNFNKIIIYKWNRDYSADKFFDLNLSEYNKIKEEEFVGNSHEKITEIIYTKEK